MRILITTDNIGGVWTYTLNLSETLTKKGVEVIIAVIGEELSANQKKQLDFTEWHFRTGRQEWMSDPWADIEKSGYWLLDLKQTLKPDILHLNSYSYGSLPWDIPVVVTAHSCVLSWWEAIKNEPLPCNWSQYREHVAEGIGSADAIVAPSASMMKSIEKFYSPGGWKRVIYNGADSTRFHVSPKEKFIFCMGRLWDEAKNIRLILEAAPMIDCNIYIAGDAADETLKYPGNVYFTGRLAPSEIADWLSEAAIYVLPVRYEPFGYSFLEAALSGCALVTGNIDSMHEIWQDAAIYADTDDSRGLAIAVNKLLENDSERESMAVKAREMALEYTSETMASNYLSLYRKMSEQLNRKYEITKQ